MHQQRQAGSEYRTHLWWRLAPEVGGELPAPVPVSWDRLRFLKLRRLAVGSDRVCPDRHNAPVMSEAVTLDELFGRVAAMADGGAGAGGGGGDGRGGGAGGNRHGGGAGGGNGGEHVPLDDASVHLEFQLLGEELLLRDVGFPNTRRCPLEFLTSHASVAWDVPGVKVPRIGCKNYWVRGRAGGSSEWSEEEEEGGRS